MLQGVFYFMSVCKGLFLLYVNALGNLMFYVNALGSRENMYDNWGKLFHDLPRLLQVMPKFLLGMVTEKEALPMPPQQGQTIQGFMKFYHLFWSFKSCINGFQYCKLVVQVNRTLLYTKYTRTLLVVVAQDENNTIFPIVFVVVKSETIEA